MAKSRELISVWNQLSIYSYLKSDVAGVAASIYGRLTHDPLRAIKAEIISTEGYFISIRPYAGESLPIDIAFCEIIENDIRLFVPDPFGSGFVIFDSGTELELNKEELIYIFNSNLTLAIDSVWHDISALSYLKYLKATMPGY